LYHSVSISFFLPFFSICSSFSHHF
jgi:hypothetical protein